MGDYLGKDKSVLVPHLYVDDSLRKSGESTDSFNFPGKILLSLNGAADNPSGPKLVIRHQYYMETEDEEDDTNNGF